MSFFVSVLLVLGWSLRKVSALASFALFSSSPWLSWLLVSPFPSLQDTEICGRFWQVNWSLGPADFSRKHHGKPSVLSHPFPQILAWSKTHPTRQMFPLNLGMSAKPLGKGLQMKSKLGCLLLLANRRKKYPTQTNSKTTENARMWSFGNNLLFVIPTNKIYLDCSCIQKHECRSWNFYCKRVIPHSKDFTALFLWV